MDGSSTGYEIGEDPVSNALRNTVDGKPSLSPPKSRPWRASALLAKLR